MLDEQTIRQRIAFHETEGRTWREILNRKSCDTCGHWALTARACNLAGGTEPPLEVQRVGCPSWAYDFVPF